MEENFTPFTITFGAGAYTVNGAAPATMGDVVKRTTLKVAASDPLFKEWGSRRGAAVPKAGSGRLGAARRGGGRFHAIPRRSDCWQGACLWARAAGRSARL